MNAQPRCASKWGLPRVKWNEQFIDPRFLKQVFLVDRNQLYQRILQLSSPWKVSSVTMEDASGEVVVEVANDPARNR